MNWSHPLLNTIVGGLMGIAGALLGVAVSIPLDDWRDRRRERKDIARRMRALLHVAVRSHGEWENSGKCLVSILDPIQEAHPQLKDLALEFEGLAGERWLSSLHALLREYEQCCQDTERNLQAMAQAHALLKHLRRC